MADEALRELVSRVTAMMTAIDHIRSTLNNVCDEIEDEGDRYYFGSTNDVERLREVAHTLDSEAWQQRLEPVKRLLKESESALSELARLRAERDSRMDHLKTVTAQPARDHPTDE